MVDPEFLAALVRAPEETLAAYRLDEEEHAAVMQAVKRLAVTPAGRRTGAFQSAMVRRLAT
jgi:hypothetical protein